MRQIQMLIEVLKVCAKLAAVDNYWQPGMPVMPLLWSESLGGLVRWIGTHNRNSIREAGLAMPPSAVTTEAIVTRTASYSLSGPYVVLEDWDMTRPHILVVSNLLRTVGKVDRRFGRCFDNGIRIHRGTWTVPITMTQLCQTTALGFVANIVDMVRKQSGVA